MEFLDLFQVALGNTNFRHVIATGVYCQLVLMCIKPREGIKDEQLENDKIFFVLRGLGEFTFNDDSGLAKEGSSILVAEETKYTLVNTGEKDLKLVVVYGPSVFADGTIHSAAAAIFDGTSSE